MCVAYGSKEGGGGGGGRGWTGGISRYLIAYKHRGEVGINLRFLVILL